MKKLFVVEANGYYLFDTYKEIFYNSICGTYWELKNDEGDLEFVTHIYNIKNEKFLKLINSIEDKVQGNTFSTDEVLDFISLEEFFDFLNKADGVDSVYTHRMMADTGWVELSDAQEILEWYIYDIQDFLGDR